MYGLNPARTRYLPAQGIKPPFRKLWRYTERPLLEFPPIFVGGKLYAVNNNGYAFALDAKTGKKLWERRIGRLNASSPAYSKHRLYIVNLVPGHIVKLDAKTGKMIWKTAAGPRRVLAGGDRPHRLLRLRRRQALRDQHRQRQRALGDPARRPGQGGARLLRRQLYVGDYGGYMNAVDAKTGKLIWQSGSLGPGFGGSGQFYSTPAVAFGRVYAGNNDGRVYSFDTQGRRTRLDLLDRRLRLLGPDRRQHRAQPADRLHRLLRRQHLRARRQGRQRALEPLGRRPGDRLALGDRRNRLRRRVHQQDDQRVHDAAAAARSSATRRAPTRR